MNYDEILKEHFNLKCWFDKEYPPQEQKYRRLKEMGIKTDYGEDAGKKLLLLYNIAETNRARINEIEEILKKENITPYI
jgi:hypothetical protein